MQGSLPPTELKERNIFSRSKLTVQEYSYVVHVPSKPREAMNDFLYTHLPDSRQDILHILDIGTGKGDFSLPFLKYLSLKQVAFRFWGFDISKKMIEGFRKRLPYYTSVPSEWVKLWIHDAAQGLPEETFPRNFYSVVIITFVLHYLHNWRDLLREVKMVIKPKGILIQGASRGYFNCLGGIFRYYEDVPSIHVDFWQQVFEWKKKMKSRLWTPAVDFTDLPEVRTFLETIQGMPLIAEKTFLWKRMISFHDVLNWIRVSPLSSIGADLNLQERQQLAQKARDWLLRKNVNLKKRYRLTFGYKLFIHKKYGSH